LKSCIFLFLIVIGSVTVLHAQTVTDTLPVISEMEEVDDVELIAEEDSVKKGFFYRILNQQRPVTFLVFPLLSYSPETNLMLGIGSVASMHLKRDTATAPSFVSPWFAYSIDKQITGEVFGSIFYKGTKHQVDYELNYKRLKQPFYGIGNKLPLDEKEVFLSQEIRLYALYQNRIAGKFLIGPVYNIDYVLELSPKAGGKLDSMDLAGKEGGLVHGAGIKTAFDNRDDVYFPYKGNYLSLTAVGYPEWLGSKYQFALVTAEYRSFINIKRKVILASQVMSQMSFGNVPFYYLPRYGSDKLLRGYTAGSGRDRYLFNLQGELRVPVKRFIFTGFFGSGIVGPAFKDYFKVKEYSYSIGGGVRFRPFQDKNIMARLDVGFWRGTYGVYFIFNEAF